MTVARQLADFLAGVSVVDLPPQAFDNAAMIIASTIASAAAGTRLASARIMRDLARERGGRPEASLWFDGDARIPIAYAAQANAVMSDAAASDDSDLRNIVHAGTPLTAVSLAIAERDGSSGEAVLAAIVCGYEAAGRISEAITPGFRARGFHGCQPDRCREFQRTLGHHDSPRAHFELHHSIGSTRRHVHPERERHSQRATAFTQPAQVQVPERCHTVSNPDSLDQGGNEGHAGSSLPCTTACAVVAPMISAPPSSAQWLGRSPCTSQAHTGFSTGSTISSSEASSAGTCRRPRVRQA